MPHDDQFTATGPSFTGAGFPRAGFSTKSTDTVYGVNVQGTRCGVYGESLAPEQETDREIEVDRVGLFGDGDRYGVHGIGRTVTGVLGLIRRPGAAGVVGIGLRDAAGVVGQSRTGFVPTLPTGDSDLHGAEGIGVLGESGAGVGVAGRCDKAFGVTGTSGTGVGGHFESREAAGVSARSSQSNGAVFESARAAQVRLVTSVEIQNPPSDGRAGDLLAIGRGEAPLGSLWFCVLGGREDRPAVWGKVQLGAMSIPNPTITTGATGQDVRNAQGLLLAHGHDPGGIDGDFGEQTFAATVDFQTQAGISPDGEIGPITWGALLNHF